MPSATDLSENGTANCYVISESGTYKFKTVKGNSSTVVGDVASCSILWETFGTNITPELNELIAAICYKDGYIAFETGSVFKEGNAVIAARDANRNVLWSWHIWLTDQPAEHVYYNNAGTMMDRNLGATSATPGDVGALGLLYQWGRKDPFLGFSSVHKDSQQEIAASTITWPDPATIDPWEPAETDAIYGTIEYSIANPTTFIRRNSATNESNDWYYTANPTDNTRWTTREFNKSIYDPCPYGWMVPAKNAYRNSDWWNNMLSSGSGVMTVGVGATCKDSNGNETNYPFSGRWRRTTADTHIAHAGTHCYLWTSTESSGLNKDYKGTWHIRVRNNNGSLSRGEETNQPRRWGANVRCVKIN